MSVSISSKLFFLIVGGALGTLSRYFVATSLYRLWGPSFPWGTMAVNVLGCFLIGLFYTIAENREFFPHAVLFMMIIGFCGSFTTFSSFILDNTLLLERGKHTLVFANMTLSIAAGFVFFYAGERFGEFFV